VDKIKILRLTRRPVPRGANTIGQWLLILKMISFLGVFFNAGLLIFTTEAIGNDFEN